MMTDDGSFPDCSMGGSSSGGRRRRNSGSVPKLAASRKDVPSSFSGSFCKDESTTEATENIYEQDIDEIDEVDLDDEQEEEQQQQQPEETNMDRHRRSVIAGIRERRTSRAIRSRSTSSNKLQANMSRSPSTRVPRRAKSTDGGTITFTREVSSRSNKSSSSRHQRKKSPSTERRNVAGDPVTAAPTTKGVKSRSMSPTRMSSVRGSNNSKGLPRRTKSRDDVTTKAISHISKMNPNRSTRKLEENDGTTKAVSEISKMNPNRSKLEEHMITQVLKQEKRKQRQEKDQQKKQEEAPQSTTGNTASTSKSSSSGGSSKRSGSSGGGGSRRTAGSSSRDRMCKSEQRQSVRRAQAAGLGSKSEQRLSVRRAAASSEVELEEEEKEEGGKYKALHSSLNNNASSLLQRENIRKQRQSAHLSLGAELSSAISPKLRRTGTSENNANGTTPAKTVAEEKEQEAEDNSAVVDDTLKAQQQKPLVSKFAVGVRILAASQE